MGKVNYNGKIFSETETPITYNSRAFRYGDGLFETVRLINGKAVFLENHIHLR